MLPERNRETARATHAALRLLSKYESLACLQVAGPAGKRRFAPDMDNNPALKVPQQTRQRKPYEQSECRMPKMTHMLLRKRELTQLRCSSIQYLIRGNDLVPPVMASCKRRIFP